ncbi:Cthrc1 [Symbiodinium natans]|uniref:Cthrc1 protein n=1 Tax=Symbiodinium natans TaxID=878477 RepID=A0A812T725_9DINO|nr:Cthrc1 [Symbiodinium natans]
MVQITTSPAKSETCKKDQLCYSPDGGKEACQDEEKKDPYLIDVHGITKNMAHHHSGPKSEKVPGRTFTFVKKKEDSILRFLYTDTFRVLCTPHRYKGRFIDGCAGRWEIKIDGKSCPSGGIYQDWYVHRFQDSHRTNGWGGVCKGVSVGKHTVQVYVGPTPWHHGWNIMDAFTGWHAGHGTPRATVHLEVQEIPEAYPLYHYKSGEGGDARDSGHLTGRHISFKKLNKDSNLRLYYSDNLRVMVRDVHRQGACACRWSIHIDGKECPTGYVAGDVYIHRHENPHRPKSMVGYCDGVDAGDHKVDVHVSTTPGYGHCDCHTGWHNSHYLLEAEEVPKPYDMVHYNMQRQTDHRDAGILNNYKVTFTKKNSETRLRLLFTENLRAYSRNHHKPHHGTTCSADWEIFVDGKSCGSASIHAQIYTRRLEANHISHNGGWANHHGWWWWVWPAHFANQDTNPHRVRTFAGFCDDVSQGEHTLTVNLKSPFGNCDLWTGWKNDPAGKGPGGTLEAIEFFRPCNEFDSKAECKQPRCHWDEDECIDLAECPGSDKVGVGADCLCGEKKAEKGKYCYEDKTVHDGVKEEAKSAARIWTPHVGLLLLPQALIVAVT